MASAAFFYHEHHLLKGKSLLCWLLPALWQCLTRSRQASKLPKQQVRIFSCLIDVRFSLQGNRNEGACPERQHPARQAEWQRSWCCTSSLPRRPQGPWWWLWLWQKQSQNLWWTCNALSFSICLGTVHRAIGNLDLSPECASWSGLQKARNASALLRYCEQAPLQQLEYCNVFIFVGVETSPLILILIILLAICEPHKSEKALAKRGWPTACMQQPDCFDMLAEGWIQWALQTTKGLTKLRGSTQTPVLGQLVLQNRRQNWAGSPAQWQWWQRLVSQSASAWKEARCRWCPVSAPGCKALWWQSQNSWRKWRFLLQLSPQQGTKQALETALLQAILCMSQNCCCQHACEKGTGASARLCAVIWWPKNDKTFSAPNLRKRQAGPQCQRLPQQHFSCCRSDASTPEKYTWPSGHHKFVKAIGSKTTHLLQQAGKACWLCQRRHHRSDWCRRWSHFHRAVLAPQEQP